MAISALDGETRLTADVADLENSEQITVSCSTSVAETDSLAAGIYDIWCDADVYIKINETVDDLTTLNGYLLRAGNTIPVIVREGRKIGTVLASGTGTFSLHKVSVG